MSDSTQDTELKQEPAQAPEPTYSAAEMRQVAEELSKMKAAAAETAAKLKQREMDDLAKNNEWQKVAEIKEREAAEAAESLNKFKTAFVQDKKMASIRELAIQSGLRKESVQDLRYIDFPEVKIETNNEGDFVVSGSDKAIQRLKATRPHWFSSAPPSINTNSPGVTSGSNSVTYADLRKAQLEAEKTGKYENYKELLFKFKAQQ